MPEGSITIVDDYAIMTTPEGDNYIITKEDAEYAEGSKEDLLQPVTSIEIEPESIEVEIGKTKTIIAKIKPEKAYSKNINWISGNEDIVKIGNKKVNLDGTVSAEITGVSAGTTSVTAKSVHGENGKEVIGEGTVKVKKAANYGTSIQTNYDNLYTTEFPDGFNGKIKETPEGLEGSIYDCANIENVDGNYREAILLQNRKIYKNINPAPYVSEGDATQVFNGDNLIDLSEMVSDEWICMCFCCRR